MQLVIDSKFRPFSYDELIKPMLQYKEAYDKVEADYSNLAAQTEQWKDIANQTQSPEAYAMYRKYSNDLNNIVDDFSKGMTLQNRSQLLNMKKRYASDIEPIAKADAAMKEANDLRVKAGPDAIFEVGEYNSLDQFLHGKKANNKYQSRDALTKRTAAMTEAAMASAMKDPEFQKAMGDQYWMLTQHTGGSYEDLKAAIANNAQAQNRFAEIKAQVMKDAGYDRYDASGKQAIEDAINTGLYAGLDKPARSFQANQNFQSDYQKDQLKLAQNADARAEKQLSLSAAGAGLKYNESTKQWERDYSLSGINPDGSPLTSDQLARAGYIEEKNGETPTGRIFKMEKGKRVYYEQDPTTGAIVKSSNQQGTAEYIKAQETAAATANNQVISANKDKFKPYYFKSIGEHGGNGFEEMGDYDSGFWGASSDKTDVKISTIKNHSASHIRDYVRSMLDVPDAPDGAVDSIINKYFLIEQDEDWLSKNHWKVSIKGFTENDDNQYDYQSSKFKETIAKMRKEVLPPTTGSSSVNVNTAL
jgi:hypothetical protein